jgi:hypothetical protein
VTSRNRVADLTGRQVTACGSRLSAASPVHASTVPSPPRSNPGQFGRAATTIYPVQGDPSGHSAERRMAGRLRGRSYPEPAPFPPEAGRAEDAAQVASPDADTALLGCHDQLIEGPPRHRDRPGGASAPGPAPADRGRPYTELSTSSPGSNGTIASAMSR